MRAKLRVSFVNSRVAKAIDLALAPDNIDLPKGMTIVQKRQGDNLVLHISVDFRAQQGFETLISTLDEIVSHIQIATGAIGEIEQNSIDKPKDPSRKTGTRKRKPSKEKYARLSSG